MNTFSCSTWCSRFLPRSEQLVGARDCHGFTPLHYAARHGSKSIIQYLLEGGADVTALDGEGHPALYPARMMEHSDVCKMLVDKILIAEADWRQAGLRESIQTIWGSVLHSSVAGMKELAEQVGSLAKKAFPSPFLHLSAIARLGDTLALRAATQVPPSRELWNRGGGDPRTGLPMSVLDNAIAGGCVEMVRILMDLSSESGITDPASGAYGNPQAYHEMATRGEVAQFRAFTAVVAALGLKWDQKILVGSLMTACEHQQLEMAHAIWSMAEADLGASLKDKQKVKLAVLGGEAAALGHLDFVQLIIEAGAPLEHRPERTQLSMMCRAAMMGQVEVIEALAQAGAKVDAEALGEALCEGHRQAAEVLIRHGADPKGRWGGDALASPAGQAIFFGREEMLLFLASHGVDFATEEYLELAKDYGAESCIAVIEDAMSKK